MTIGYGFGNLSTLRLLRSLLRPASTRPINRSGSRCFHLAVVGSGPAGFYSSYRLMTRMPNARVDMFEQLPVPFGLVRFGVAPDHPEVKNCQDKFSEVASSPRFRFVGNVEVGRDVSLSALRSHYDAILFAYGASKDRKLGIPGEGLRGVHSARAFVGWYNGLPEYAGLQPELDKGDSAVVVGHGNVALDIARVLLSDFDRLCRTDITDGALEVLAKSRIRRVSIVGRRGPMQASFTIKEIRELMHLPGVTFEEIPADLLPGPEVKLPRAQKRIAQLFSTRPRDQEMTARQWSLDFLESPTEFFASRADPDHLYSLRSSKNAFQDEKSRFDRSAKIESTGGSFERQATIAFRSIGYKSEPIPGMDDLGITFDARAGVILNQNGKVVSNEGEPLPGLYCAGWVKCGPTGVIATTMEDAFATAEAIAQDWRSEESDKGGWRALRTSVPASTNWADWLKIDHAEKERGQRVGKEREKFTSIAEMLQIL